MTERRRKKKRKSDGVVLAFFVGNGGKLFAANVDDKRRPPSGALVAGIRVPVWQVDELGAAIPETERLAPLESVRQLIAAANQ